MHQPPRRLREVLRGKTPGPDLQRYLTLLDGTRTLRQVVEECEEDELKLLGDIAKLYQRGLVEPAGAA